MNLFYSAAEAPALQLLSTKTSTPVSDMDALALALKQVQAQLDRVLAYVREVIAGDRKGDATIGRYILDAISKVPVGGGAKDVTNANGESKLEELFNTHLQVSRWLRVNTFRSRAAQPLTPPRARSHRTSSWSPTWPTSCAAKRRSPRG